MTNVYTGIFCGDAACQGFEGLPAEMLCGLAGAQRMPKKENTLQQACSWTASLAPDPAPTGAEQGHQALEKCLGVSLLLLGSTVCRFQLPSQSVFGYSCITALSRGASVVCHECVCAVSRN